MQQYQILVIVDRYPGWNLFLNGQDGQPDGSKWIYGLIWAAAMNFPEVKYLQEVR